MQEYNRFDQDVIVESDNLPAYRSNRANRRASVAPGLARAKTYFLFGAGTIAAVVVGYGVFTVRQFMPFVGVLALLIAIILLLCAGAWAILSVIRYATRADFYPVEENGAYLRNSLGRVTPLAPMIAAPAKVSKSTGKVEISPVVPTIFDLIEAGEIAQGEMQMVMGYDKIQLEKGILQLVIGSWPGTHAVAGKGRSGKTRRVIGMIAQALIAGARVIVCDPHYSKLDSLARSLEPLEKYLTIARGEEQIVAASREFLREMEARVDDPTRPCLPWLIVYDEWSREMDENNAKMPEGGRDILIDVAKNCSTQYAGYLGYCCLIGQIWTNEACGGTDIRRSLQSVFIHQLSAEYASFFVRAAKWKNKVEELKRRECVFRDVENQVSVIVTVGIPDDTAARVAVYLASQGFPELNAPAPARAELPAMTYYQPLQGGEPAPLYLPAPAPGQYVEGMEPLPPLYPRENERRYAGSAPEVIYGSAPEVDGKYPGSEAEVAEARRGSEAEAQVKALREIAKRLRKGETPVEIRKSLGVDAGRALQEVNEALRILGESEGE